MTTSPARIAANQRNASKSTGPKTAEGKAVSRLNAFKHGLAGDGVVLAPGEDAALVARRSKAFAAELGASGDVGDLLAHRAALLSVRMERSADRNETAVVANMAEARARFDQDRFHEIDGWIAQLDDPETCLAALEVLATSPEGVNHLITTWGALLEAIRSDDRLASDQAKKQAALRLGLGVEEEAEVSNAPGAASPTEPIEAELARLRLLAESMISVERAVEAQREHAAILASFDPSPEATLARRYEAAAERGMYRAIRALAEVRRGKEVDVAAILRDAPPRPTPAPPSRPEPAPLGSFRAGVSPAPILPTQPVVQPVEPAISAEEHRKKRPDLRKLLAKRR